MSIVVPAYNGAPYLREALDSIVGQTYPRTEVLVMDDASTDETPQIVASYGEAVTHHRQRQTRGQFENVNDGIALVSGELVAVYHADDAYHPRLVEREVDYLNRHPKVGAVFCKGIFVDADGRPFGRLELPPELADEAPLEYATVLRALLTYKNTFLPTPSSMVRAGVYREVGAYDPRFGTSSDFEMWLRIARHHDLAVLNEHLYRYRRGYGSLSERYQDLRAEPEQFFEIVDRELSRGGRDLVDHKTLADYEAHRAEDQLKISASNYILGRLGRARAVGEGVRVRRILGSKQVTRARLLVLAAIMHGLVRLPRIPLAAYLLKRQMFEQRTPRPQPDLGWPSR